jgi:hypothetical protein
MQTANPANLPAIIGRKQVFTQVGFELCRPGGRDYYMTVHCSGLISPDTSISGKYIY